MSSWRRKTPNPYLVLCVSANFDYASRPPLFFVSVNNSYIIKIQTKWHSIIMRTNFLRLWSLKNMQKVYVYVGTCVVDVSCEFNSHQNVRDKPCIRYKTTFSFREVESQPTKLQHMHLFKLCIRA